MLMSHKGNRKHVIQISKIHDSGARLALVTLRILLYLWQAGKLVAQRTYRYSTKIKNSSNNLFPRHGVSMLVGRRSLSQLSRVVPPFGTSWQHVKSLDWKLWRNLNLTGYSSSNLHLKYASQYILSRAKMAAASRLNGVCGIGTWKRSLRQFAGANLAAKALSKITRFNYRYGTERQKTDRRRSFKNSLRLARAREQAVTNLSNRSYLTSKDTGIQELEEKHLSAIIQQSDGQNSEILKPFNKRLMLYKKMPLKTMSRLWGQFNQLELPVWLRKPALGLYVWMFNCTLEDAAVQDLKRYRNLSEFFRRRLRAGIRPIDGAHILTSPADGRVLNCGVVENGALEQIKGVTYSLQGFLGPLCTPLTSYKKLSVVDRVSDVDNWQQLLCNPVNKLYHCVIYLAPGDYHRFHSPADWNVYARRHFPGELFSVNPGVARWLQGLFNFNERAVYTGTWTHGFFSMTAVGATNVGSINVDFDQTLTTNSTSHFPYGSFNDHNFASDKKRSIALKKGQPVGDFNLGSTIVLLFEAPDNFIFNVRPGQRLRYGQGIGGCIKQLVNHGIKHDK